MDRQAYGVRGQTNLFGVFQPALPVLPKCCPRTAIGSALPVRHPLPTPRSHCHLKIMPRAPPPSPHVHLLHRQWKAIVKRPPANRISWETHGDNVSPQKAHHAGQNNYIHARVWAEFMLCDTTHDLSPGRGRNCESAAHWPFLFCALSNVRNTCSISS